MQAHGSNHTRSWHFENDTTDLAASIAHTLSIQDAVDDEAAVFLNHNLDFHDLQPAAIYVDEEVSLYGACWHRGAHYDYVLVGEPAHVMQYCDLTSGERETITLTARRLGGEQEKVYAVASGTLKHLHHSLNELHGRERLTICGLVAHP